ncbi:MAG: 5'-3' exonuclease H3TH domain-containing protein, partial [Bellilinea sp.]
MPPILFLIDGHALAYRTYFAITLSGQQLTTSSGEPTAGIYGFASVLLRLLEQENPEYLAVAFDTGATFRNNLYPEYKATRAKMPDELRPQIERIREMVDIFGFPRLEAEGFEADDVLGSIARKAAENGLAVKIITGDRDLLQLVNDRVIVNLAGSKLSEARDYGVREVIETLGIHPGQVVDYKALVGDKSDNIPGVAGIGEKTAILLLQQYANLDDIYAHLDQIPPRVRNLLEKDREKAYLSRQLATIRTDLPVMLSLEQARTAQINLPAVEEFFQRLEFRSLLPRLKKLENQVEPVPTAGQQLSLFGEPLVKIGEPPPQDGRWVAIQTREALAELCQKLEGVKFLSIDTETTSTDPMRAELVGISLAFESGEGYYLPVGHRTGEEQLPIGEALEALRPVLTSPQVAKIGHNLKYDALVLENQGVPVAPMTFDTMIAAWLVQPENYNLGLKELAQSYLGVQMTHIEELIGKGKNQTTMDRVPIGAAA